MVHDSPYESVSDLSVTHLWLADLDGRETYREEHHCLTPLEMARARRLMRSVDRRRYIARKVLVRHILGNIAELSPGALRMAEDSCGRPSFHADAPKGGQLLPGLGYSTSDTENVFGLAVVFGGRVGLDLEVVRPELNVLEVASAAFGREEVGRLMSLPGRSRTMAFYRAWTMKEASAKMLGVGLVDRWSGGSYEAPAALHSFEFESAKARVAGALAVGRAIGPVTGLPSTNFAHTGMPI